jgi:hypothetical protein
VNRLITLCCCLTTAALLSPLATRADDNDKPSAAKLAQSQFDQLKRLAGQWTGKAPHETGQHEGTITYKLTSGGSAVMETAFAGTDHEMITMYHLDGDAIVLTHYCVLGNQPRMKCVPTADAKKLDFKFSGGTNLDPAKDMHMHDATFELLSDDHIRTTWTMYSAGKPDHSSTFDLQRKK